MLEDRRNLNRYFLEKKSEDELKSFINIGGVEIKISPDNLSQSGINFKLNIEAAGKISAQSSLKFKFILDNSFEVNALGKIIWKTKISGSGNDYYSLGFHLFISEQKEQKYFEDFLNTLE